MNALSFSAYDIAEAAFQYFRLSGQAYTPSDGIYCTDGSWMWVDLILDRDFEIGLLIHVQAPDDGPYDYLFVYSTPDKMYVEWLGKPHKGFEPLPLFDVCEQFIEWVRLISTKEWT